MWIILLFICCIPVIKICLIDFFKIMIYIKKENFIALCVLYIFEYWGFSGAESINTIKSIDNNIIIICCSLFSYFIQDIILIHKLLSTGALWKSQETWPSRSRWASSRCSPATPHQPSSPLNWRTPAAWSRSCPTSNFCTGTVLQENVLLLKLLEACLANEDIAESGSW